ncbi:MAG: hypothetical protein ABIH18_07200 [Candidatus Omnitrophota bacterium]
MFMDSPIKPSASPRGDPEDDRREDISQQPQKSSVKFGIYADG